MQSVSSAWPLPSMPAMPTISPACTSSERPLTASMPRASLTWRSRMERTTSPGVAGFFSTWKFTWRPTILEASSSSLVFDTSTVPM